jgi:hypothetical protein
VPALQYRTTVHSRLPESGGGGRAYSGGGGRRVFAGQRAEGFYVDLGSIFDLGDLRPFASAHNHFGLAKFPTNEPGVNATKDLNVHTIVLQVPITDLTRHTRPAATAPEAVIGVWTTASRQRVRLWEADRGEDIHSGPFTPVSRLGNPLFNEVIVPMGKKDLWNTLPPTVWRHRLRRPVLVARPATVPGPDPEHTR